MIKREHTKESLKKITDKNIIMTLVYSESSLDLQR